MRNTCGESGWGRVPLTSAQRLPVDASPENQKLGITGFAEGCAVTVRHGMDDVAADADVRSDWNTESIASRGDTEMTVVELLVIDHSAKPPSSFLHIMPPMNIRSVSPVGSFHSGSELASTVVRFLEHS